MCECEVSVVSTQCSTVPPLCICAGLLPRGHVLSAEFAVVVLAALGLLRVICVGGYCGWLLSACGSFRARAGA
jgi:hypothetical protein